jgi:ADP-ribose pyrophosphatase YjhB (NUDIX family)
MKGKNTIVSLIDGASLKASDEPFKFVQTLSQRDAATDPTRHKTKMCRYFPDCEFGDECTFIHPAVEEGIPCVAVVLYNQKGNYLAGVEPKGKPDAGAWGIPTGKVKHGEKAVIAAARTLEEETGMAIKADDLRFETQQDYTDEKGVVYKTDIYVGFKSKCTPGKAIAKDKRENMMYIGKSTDLTDFFDNVVLTYSMMYGDGLPDEPEGASSSLPDALIRPPSPFKSALPASARWCNEVEDEGAAATPKGEGVSMSKVDVAHVSTPGAPKAPVTSESPSFPVVHPERDEDAGSHVSADSVSAGKTAAAGPFRMLIDNIAAMPDTTAGCDDAATSLRVTYVEEGDGSTGKAAKTHTKRYFFLKWDTPKKEQLVLICGGRPKGPKIISLNDYNVANNGPVIAESRDISKPNTTVLTGWEQMMMDYILLALQGF